MLSDKNVPIEDNSLLSNKPEQIHQGSNVNYLFPLFVLFFISVSLLAFTLIGFNKQSQFTRIKAAYPTPTLTINCATVYCTHQGINASLSDKCYAGDGYGKGCFVGYYWCPEGTDVSNGCQMNGNSPLKKAGFNGCETEQIDLYCPPCFSDKKFMSRINQGGTCGGISPSPKKTKTPTPGGPSSAPKPTKTKTPTPKFTKTPTPKLTKTPTPKFTKTPTPTVSPSPTPTTPVLSCTHWGIDENSSTDSQLVKINEPLTSLSLVKTYPCKEGICDFESLEIHPVTKVLYAAPRTTRSLYTINTNPDDSVEDGALSLIAKISPDIAVNDLSFRKSDNSLWAWANGKGLYIINISNGTATAVFSSALDHVDGIAWDNKGQYLYASRTPSSSPKYANYELHRYDPATNSLAYYASLPNDTDALDYRSSDDLLIGAYGVSGGVKFYSYDVISKTVKANYEISTSYKNIDALTICN
ncbi:hypothetical protein HY612_03680 [Candidatus Roizmanbacteria bacterium]|nr:hypothetical protein [Candidatus Roizmanbacteria bacterium]